MRTYAAQAANESMSYMLVLFFVCQNAAESEGSVEGSCHPAVDARHKSVGERQTERRAVFLSVTNRHAKA